MWEFEGPFCIKLVISADMPLERDLVVGPLVSVPSSSSGFMAPRKVPPTPASQVVEYDLLNLPLHTFRDDQKLVNDCIVKVFSPEGPVTMPTADHSNSPSHLSGLVRTRRVIVSPDRAEEHRELCSEDLFDTVLSTGGSLTGGSLVQGCACNARACHAAHC